MGLGAPGCGRTLRPGRRCVLALCLLAVQLGDAVGAALGDGCRY
eukprot:gene14681-30355_t